VSITDTGAVQVDGTALGQLRVERPGTPPLRDGTNRWIPQGDAEALTPGEFRVQQGHIEESNVDPVSALVEMIEIQRAYTAIQKSIQTTDGVMQTVTSDLGRVNG
jgi:flagellar basal-body rod protein FlgG